MNGNSSGNGSGGPGNDDYKVGYKSPPLHSRFRKGQSGNPRGAPKRVLNFANDLRRTLELSVEINENGKPKRATTQQGIMLRLREMALKGNNRALTGYLTLARELDAANKVVPFYDLTLLSDEDLEIVEGILEKVATAKTT